MVLGDLAFRRQCGGDRDAQFLDRGAQGVGGLRADDAAARQQQRPLGLGDHVGDAADGVLVRPRAARGGSPGRRPFDRSFHLCELDVVGELHEYRARPSRRRDLHRGVEDLDDAVGPDDHPGALGHRLEHRHCILEAVIENLLHAGLAHEMGGAAAGNDQHRRGIVHGARGRADRVEETGTFVDQHRRDLAGDAVVHVGHVHGVGFVLGLNAVERIELGGECVQERPDRAAGITEILVVPGDLEPLGDCIDDAHGGLPLCSVARLTFCNNIRCCQRPVSLIQKSFSRVAATTFGCDHACSNFYCGPRGRVV